MVYLEPDWLDWVTRRYLVGPQGQFSPLVIDTSFQCVLIVALMKQWKMEVVHFETASLYGVLDE